MAQSVQETEGLDLDSFLKSKNLSDLIPKFKEAGITLDVLVDCNEKDVKYVRMYVIC